MATTVDGAVLSGVARATAALDGVFYVDDPQDGASAHLLAEVGVTLHRGGGDVSPAGGWAPAPAASDLEARLLAAEHTLSVPCRVTAHGPHTTSALLVDVRDSADAWVRIVLMAGDALVLQPNVKRRLPPAGTRVVTMPPVADPSIADRDAKQCTTLFPRPAGEIVHWATPSISVAASDGGGTLPPALSSVMTLRFAPGSAEEAAAQVPHFAQPGTPHTRDLVVELCESFYHLGWVTGTGGSISIRHGNRIFMAPSGVQKERMQRQDIFVLDTAGKEIYAPAPLPGKKRLKLSQCAPLFHHAFTLRKAGACIHSHDIHAVMCTLLNDTEFSITHQEMIKGILGHGFLDQCVVPIIENTPHECDLADSLQEAMVTYPKANAVLVRRHGVYVWGPTWQDAKTQAECYHYLFDAAVRMRAVGVDPAAIPARHTHGIGATTSYGTAGAGMGGGGGGTVHKATNGVTTNGDACCGGGGAPPHAHGPTAVAAMESGFHGTRGTNALITASASTPPSTTAAATTAPAHVTPLPLDVPSARAIVLDIEGATTPLSFVTDVLFPYAADHAAQHLTAAWGTAEGVADVAALAEQSRQDMAGGLMGATLAAVTPAHVAAYGDAHTPTAARAAVVDAIVDNVKWLMSTDRKVGALKQLQGHIWRSGYAAGTLKGQVFDDVPTALRGWVKAGRRVYIYSSGSREAQRLLFAHTNHGDLRSWLSGYFDTKVGPKVAADSYADIALSLGVDAPSHILFATDSLAEARAAAAAGLQVAITVRPGNLPLPSAHGFPVVNDLLALTPP